MSISSLSIRSLLIIITLVNTIIIGTLLIINTPRTRHHCQQLSIRHYDIATIIAALRVYMKAISALRHYIIGDISGGRWSC